MGILFAVIALVGWGFGDFLIQRSARAFGNGIALFCITLIGSIILFPFILGDISQLWLTFPQAALIICTSIVMLGTAMVNFEALRIGKLSVIEPIYAAEVLVTVGLSVVIAHERLSALQYILIGTLLCGIVLVSTKSVRQFTRAHLEKGVILAIIAMVGLGASNFLVGLSSHDTDPILINWLLSVVITIALIPYLSYTHQWNALKKNWQTQKGLILSVGFFDNVAWVAFAMATARIPIAIASGISESYILLAALLGCIINHERLHRHQWLGFAIAVGSAMTLALQTTG